MDGLINDLNCPAGRELYQCVCTAITYISYLPVCEVSKRALLIAI